MQLSYNKLRTFGECRLKYRLAYVERLPQPAISALSFHRKLHAALRQYHHFARRDGVVEEAELLKAYAHIYDAQRQPEVQESKAYQEGVKFRPIMYHPFSAKMLHRLSARVYQATAGTSTTRLSLLTWRAQSPT